MSWLKHGMKHKIEKNNVLKQNITKIAKAAFYKLPGKSSLNVNFVCPTCSVCPDDHDDHGNNDEHDDHGNNDDQIGV